MAEENLPLQYAIDPWEQKQKLAMSCLPAVPVNLSSSRCISA